MPATLTVRRAAASDVAALVGLMHDFYAESGFELDHAWAAASFARLLADPALGCVWLAQDGALPAGHAVLTLRYTMEHGGLGGYIDDLYVRPEFRRIGAATALLSQLFAESRVRGCKSVQVEAGESNVAALAVYAKFGLRAAQDGRLLLSGTLAGAAGPAFF